MNKKKKSTNTSPYPDEVIDRLARAFYPAILACWNSEEGQRSLVGGKAPPSCLRKTVRSLKSPTGAFIAPLRCANASLPRGRRNRLILQPKKNRKFPLGNSLPYLSCVDFSGCVRQGAPCFFVFRPLVRDFQTCYSYILSSHDGSLRRLSPHMPENQIQFARRTIH